MTSDFPSFVSDIRKDPKLAWLYGREQPDRKLFQKNTPNSDHPIFFLGGKTWHVEFDMTMMSQDNSETTSQL